jgi:hypothetical protein
MARDLRKTLELSAVLVFDEGSTPCVISDISKDGAYVSLAIPDLVPERAVLWMTPDGKVKRPCTIVTRTLTGVGVQFE